MQPTFCFFEYLHEEATVPFKHLAALLKRKEAVLDIHIMSLELPDDGASDDNNDATLFLSITRRAKNVRGHTSTGVTDHDYAIECSVLHCTGSASFWRIFPFATKKLSARCSSKSVGRQGTGVCEATMILSIVVTGGHFPCRTFPPFYSCLEMCQGAD